MLNLMQRKAATSNDVLQKAQAAFEIKAIDEETRRFSGLASTWAMDLGGDVIHRGAFKKTLNDWRGSGRVLPLIDQHGYHSVRQVVGKMVDAKETADGLEAEFEIIEGPDGDEIYRRVKGGYITGLSIGYRAIKIEAPTEEEERAGVWRHLKEVKLEEVSVVIWPMNPEAQISDVKALQERLESGTLTDDDRQQISRMFQKYSALQDTPAEESEPSGEAAHYERTDELKARIRSLRIRRAVAGHSV